MEEEEEELVPNFLADTKYLEDYTQVLSPHSTETGKPASGLLAGCIR
jgi:hypothetical protein